VRGPGSRCCSGGECAARSPVSRDSTRLPTGPSLPSAAATVFRHLLAPAAAGARSRPAASFIRAGPLAASHRDRLTALRPRGCEAARRCTKTSPAEHRFAHAPRRRARIDAKVPPAPGPGTPLQAQIAIAPPVEARSSNPGLSITQLRRDTLSLLRIGDGLGTCSHHQRSTSRPPSRKLTPPTEAPGPFDQPALAGKGAGWRDPSSVEWEIGYWDGWLRWHRRRIRLKPRR